MRCIRNLAFALAAAALAVPAQAANTYNITQNQSQLNLTAGGTILGSALTVTEQQVNAITRYNGTLAVGFSNEALGPVPGSAINFPGGSAASAVNPTGLFNIPLQYTPNVGGAAGTAAGNYGVNISAPIGIAIPSFEVPVGETTITLNLGTLQSFSMTMAVRDLDLDVTGGDIAIGPGGVFDANGTSLSIATGFADLNGALVFDQTNLIETLAVAAALNVLAGSVPDLGLTVSTNLLASTVSLGIGTRIDLATLGDAALANQAATDGTVSPGSQISQSTLILPVNITLPSLEELGLPPEVLDLQLSLAGQLRATGFITEIPEPSSLVLGAFAASGIALVIRRRRRSA